MLNEVNNSVFLEGESPALNYLKNALNEETQIFRLPQFYIYYVFEMEKCQGFRTIYKKLVEKLLFCAFTNIQFKEPVRNFEQFSSQNYSYLVS